MRCLVRALALCLALLPLHAPRAEAAKGSPRHHAAMQALKAECAEREGLQFDGEHYKGPPEAKQAFLACIGKTGEGGDGNGSRGFGGGGFGGSRGGGGRGGLSARARESIQLCAPDRMRLCGTTDRQACPLRQRLSELSPPCRERVLEFMQQQR